MDTVERQSLAIKLIQILQENPGQSVRQLLKQIRSEGILTIEKNDVNSVLYGFGNYFRRVETQPPCWYANQDTPRSNHKQRIEVNKLDSVVPKCTQNIFVEKHAIDKNNSAHDKKPRKYLPRKSTLVKNHMHLVESFAKNFVNCGLEHDDIIQEGRVGLLKAAELYKDQINYSFSSYAIWWIHNTIISAIINQSITIKIPIAYKKSLDNLFESSFQIAAEQNRAPSPEEIAERMHVTPGKVRKLRKYLSEIELFAYNKQNDDDSDEFLPSDSETQLVTISLWNTNLKVDVYFKYNGNYVGNFCEPDDLEEIIIHHVYCHGIDIYESIETKLKLEILHKCWRDIVRRYKVVGASRSEWEAKKNFKTIYSIDR